MANYAFIEIMVAKAAMSNVLRWPVGPLFEHPIIEPNCVIAASAYANKVPRRMKKGTAVVNDLEYTATVPIATPAFQDRYYVQTALQTISARDPAGNDFGIDRNMWQAEDRASAEFYFDAIYNQASRSIKEQINIKFFNGFTDSQLVKNTDGAEAAPVVGSADGVDSYAVKTSIATPDEASVMDLVNEITSYRSETFGSNEGIPFVWCVPRSIFNIINSYYMRPVYRQGSEIYQYRATSDMVMLNNIFCVGVDDQYILAINGGTKPTGTTDSILYRRDAMNIFYRPYADFMERQGGRTYNQLLSAIADNEKMRQIMDVQQFNRLVNELRTMAFTSNEPMKLPKEAYYSVVMESGSYRGNALMFMESTIDVVRAAPYNIGRISFTDTSLPTRSVASLNATSERLKKEKIEVESKMPSAAKVPKPVMGNGA